MKIEKVNSGTIFATGLVFLICVFTLLIMLSCSQTKETTISCPNSEIVNVYGYEVVWCNEEFIWIQNYQGKICKIRNNENWILYVGDSLYLKEEFRVNNYGL